MDELQQALTQLLLAVAAAGIALVVKKVRDLVNSIKNEKLRAEMDKALVNSIKWAHGQYAQGVVPNRTKVLSDAMTYIYANLPGIVKALGLDEDSVKKLIEARL